MEKSEFKNVVIWDVRFALVDDDGKYYEDPDGRVISFQHRVDDFMELSEDVTPDDLTNPES